MVKIAYLSSLMSVYDSFFLKKLGERFDLIPLTFSSNPKYPPKDGDLIVLPELIPPLPAHDSPRIYSSIPFKVTILKNILKKINPDVLIGCGGLGDGFIGACSNYKPFSLFIWASEVLVWPRILFLRALVKYSLGRADLVLVDNPVVREACTKLGCSGRKIITLPWTDYEDLRTLRHNVKVEKSMFRLSFGWNENDPIVICTRSHEKVYDIPTIVRAIPLVLHEVPNARFLFVGMGSLTYKLLRMTTELKLHKNVRFTGFIQHERIFYYLVNSDIYVSSSLSDGTSASLLEAMSCELPCVVSDIPANREWIVEGENGFLFPPRASAELARKLVILIKDEDKRVKLGQRGFTTVKNRTQWSRDALILYDSLEMLAKKDNPFSR